MSAAPARLVHIPETQTASPAVLRLLRALHPRLEIVCLSPGLWWIGEVKPTCAAVMAGQQQKRRLRARLKQIGAVRAVSFWKAELMSQGFRMLAMVQAPQPTPTQCYLAVAPALRATPKSVERAFEAQLKVSSGDAQREAATERLRDYAHYVGRDAYRHAFHRPIHSLPGATR